MKCSKCEYRHTGFGYIQCKLTGWKFCTEERDCKFVDDNNKINWDELNKKI